MDSRTNAALAIKCIEAAILARNVPTGEPTVASDRAPQFISAEFREYLSDCGIAHRMGNQQSQEVIEAWADQLRRRLSGQASWKNADEASNAIATCFEQYNSSGHSPDAAAGVASCG